MQLLHSTRHWTQFYTNCQLLNTLYTMWVNFIYTQALPARYNSEKYQQSIINSMFLMEEHTYYSHVFTDKTHILTSDGRLCMIISNFRAAVFEFSVDWGLNPQLFSKVLCWSITYTVTHTVAPPPHDGPKVTTTSYFWTIQTMSRLAAGLKQYAEYVFQWAFHTRRMQLIQKLIYHTASQVQLTCCKILMNY
jgi:hypothetical protein